MNTLLDYSILGNSVAAYLGALAVFAAGVLALSLVRKLILKKVEIHAGLAAKALRFFVLQSRKNLLPLGYATVFYFSAGMLKWNPALNQGIRHLWLIFVSFLVLRSLMALFSYVIEEIWLSGSDPDKKAGMSKSILGILSVVVWSVGVVFLLDNLGFNVSAVVAGLGISGIAVALAAQTILGDLFNSFVIFFDKPFEVGDTIALDDLNGKIERVGIKTTRIRSATGEQIILPNTALTSSRIHNFKRMQERRVVQSVGLIYETPGEKLKGVPELLKKIVTETGQTRFDRAHFKQMGDFSLNFELVYFVMSPEYNVLIEVQQKINYLIFEEFGKRGLEFAYPTSVQYVKA